MSPLEKYLLKRFEDNEEDNYFSISISNEEDGIHFLVEKMCEPDECAEYLLNDKNKFVCIYKGEYDLEYNNDGELVEK